MTGKVNARARQNIRGAVIASLAFGLLPLFIGAAPLLAQGAVSGMVTDAESLAPVAGAQVFVAGTVMGTLSGPEGTYRLVGVPAGEQTVTVRLIGYHELSQTLTVASGQVATADFAVEQTALRRQDIVVTGVVGETPQVKLPFTVERLSAQDLPGTASAQEREDAVETVRNVQLVFHLVEADGFTDDDPEISDVVSELKRLFNFQGYRLLSTSILNVGLARTSNVRVGGTGSQRIVAGDSATPLTIHAEISARRATRNVRAKVTLAGETSGTSRLQEREGGVFRMEVLGPLLEASVTIRDGQRVVLGSARRSAEDPVLILIVTPSLDPS